MYITPVVYCIFMMLQQSKKREIEREKKLVSLTARRYNILKTLYSGDEYNLTKLKDFINALEEKDLNMGNFSKEIKALKEKGLVEKKGRIIMLSPKARNLVYVIMETARPEEERKWQPQIEEVELCIEVLKAKANKEMKTAFLSELSAILNSGYWDKQLTIFFTSALETPETYEAEISRLLGAEPKNHESVDSFFKNNMDKIYALVKTSDKLCTLAIRTCIDISEEREVLVKMEMDLEGEGAERVMMAAQGYGFKLYEKFNLDFKKFLHMALGHKNKTVKELALNLMSEVHNTKASPPSSLGRYSIS